MSGGRGTSSFGGAARLIALAAVLLAVVPAAASAADPGRWSLVDRASIPINYYQGMTSAPDGDLFFDGVYTGLYRSNSQLEEEGANPNVFPASVGTDEGYNHIGDISYDAAEGGRILLPLECYYPGTPGGANTCQTGSIGVADPDTLQWRYYVKLDDGPIRKAMWAEVSPDGSDLWTQGSDAQGATDDLLVYHMSDISSANQWTGPGSPEIQPYRILHDKVPPSGITGATFFRGRLYVAGQDGDVFQVWSIDRADGSRRLEIERQIVGESEGLDVFGSLGGVLHWQIQPFAPGEIPTYDPTQGSLLSFVPIHAEVADADDDGVADHDDACPDVAGAAADGCPTSPAPAGDDDQDGVPLAQDNCRRVANNFQANADQDGHGDVCDADDDDDQAADGADNCQFRANLDQRDGDGDGTGDACEDDDDNDGVADFRDNCSLTPNGDQADGDGDGIGDACDAPEAPPAESADRQPPETTIGKVEVRSRKRRATIVFASNEPGSSFECTLDRKRLKKCSSPLRLKHLQRGKHRFTVAARDAAGNLDPTPAKQRIRIKKQRKRHHGHDHHHRR